MKIHESLDVRMKKYEYVNRTKLIPHIPTIIRLDGKSFHSVTKGMDKPFDDTLHNSMCYAMEESMRNVIQNAVFSFTQSDEISILLKDYPNFNTEQWFAGNIQKICSVSASSITYYFNEYIRNIIHNFEKLALFDARVFQLPLEEVENYFIWRQQDATKNSIQMLAQSKFSHKSLQNLNSDQLQTKLITESDTNWNDLDVWKKRGSTCYRMKSGIIAIDNTPPIFTKDREYINKHLITPNQGY